MFCSKCGNKIEDSAKFCDSCGNAVAVEQLGTNASVTVSTKKVNKKLPVILGICVVVIILIAISISVLGKKADKVARIVNAYENTINAENFDIYLGVAERHWCMEVFGKESFEDTYIATFFNNDLGYESDNWLKYINGEDLYRLIHDEYYVDKGRDTLKNNASDWFAYDEYEMIAKRDFEALWNHEFSDEIGLTYDEAYDLATSIVLNYLKNKNDSAVESIEIEDNKYSIRCGVDNFAEDSEYEDTVNEFIDYIEDEYIYAYDCDEGCKLEEIYFEVKLEGKYIKSLSIYLTFDTEINGKDEIPFFILQFANVNELTKETSLAYKLYNELKEDTVVKEAVVQEAVIQDVVAEEAVAEAVVSSEQSWEEQQRQKEAALDKAYFDFFEAKFGVDNREYEYPIYYAYVDINSDYIREMFYINQETKECYLVYTTPNDDGSYTVKEQYMCPATGDLISHDMQVLNYCPFSGAIHTASRDIDIKNAISGLVNKENSYFNYLVFKYDGVAIQKVYADVEYRNEELDEMSVSITENLADYFEVSLNDSYSCKMRWDGNEDRWVGLSDTDFDRFAQLMDSWFGSNNITCELNGEEFRYSATTFMELAYDCSRNDLTFLSNY